MMDLYLIQKRCFLKNMNKISTTISEIKLDSPLIAASGTIGYGLEFSKIANLSSFGAISIKGTTLKPRFGNLSPRLAETPSGILNSIGLENPGIDWFIEHGLPWLQTKPVKILANIAGFSEFEFEQLAEKLDSTVVDFLELNVSCPNVKKGGVNFGTCSKLIFDLVSKTRKKTKKPLIVKLTPNVTSITEIAKSAECAGADAVSLINTIAAMKIDIKTKRPILKNNFGGLSGPAIFPIAVKMVFDVFKAIKIPIIGGGGVSSFENVIELMLAGASAIELGTILFSKPNISQQINSELIEWCDQNNIENISQIVGAVEPWET